MKGKKILIGISGGIAAYKIPLLVRLLVTQGAEVKIVMSDAATQFVSPLVLSTLSKNPVQIHLQEQHQWNNHIQLAHWSDLILFAPCTANTLSKMANGLCDNLLMAVYLSATCPILIAPAMDHDMWQHQSVQDNCSKLSQRDQHYILHTNYGELASGLIGFGRMLEPDELFKKLENHFYQNQLLQNKKALVSAGPTYENIDPVRFIGNHSSGKMGIAIAEALAEQGAEVHLVLGPTYLKPQNPNIKIYPVVSASQMYDECVHLFQTMDIAVMSAAVADYTPVDVSDKKNKKNAETIEIQLKKTIDILKYLGEIKKENQTIVGFALENFDEKNYAQKKLKEKKADAIVLNSLNDPGAGFAYDTNKITIFDKYNNVEHFELKSKKEVAKDIVKKIIHLNSL
ncbi:MAG TPA: bifunctional phosphopantothenoylcysteine decarboxylase/phosphopantothenate--cysteine ligase CoaBC [Chitinophagaceae bacterium]|nr:bifunctional phosphopantothenoylcysteine decarboxylase/phosphopantothenate--cysteine ligase CoaBC [Chitinophagaceae bacterium]